MHNFCHTLYVLVGSVACKYVYGGADMALGSGHPKLAAIYIRNVCGETILWEQHLLFTVAYVLGFGVFDVYVDQHFSKRCC